MHRKLSASKCITLGAMVIALTLLSLYAAAALPAGNLAFYFLSSVFIYVLTSEKAYLSAFVCFIATSALAFLILPDKTTVFYYVILIGHYGILYTFVDSHVNSKFFRIMCRLLYCDIFALIGVYLLQNVLFLGPVALPGWLPIWLAVLIGQAAFIAVDFLYRVCIQIYQSRIRSSMIPRR